MSPAHSKKRALFSECGGLSSEHGGLSFQNVYGLCRAVSFQNVSGRGGGLGSSTIFKKFNEPYAPS